MSEVNKPRSEYLDRRALEQRVRILERKMLTAQGFGTQPIGGSWTLIEEQTISAATAAITFDDIPADFTDLVLHAYARTDRAAPALTDGFSIQVGNGAVDTGGNYHLAGAIVGGLNDNLHSNVITDFRPGFATQLGQEIAGALAAAGAVAGVLGRLEFRLYDYADATRHRHAWWETSVSPDASNAFRILGQGVWKNAADIVDVLRISPRLGTNFIDTAGTVFRLYGRFRGAAS